jgi:hypothetical protein
MENYITFQIGDFEFKVNADFGISENGKSTRDWSAFFAAIGEFMTTYGPTLIALITSMFASAKQMKR